MCSNAFKLDARMKKYEVMTSYLKWDRDIKLQRHQLRIKNIKPAIDNKSPDRGPFLSLNVKKMRLQEERLCKIRDKNLVYLKRLRSLHEVRMSDFCHRKRSALIRGDAYKLKPPSGKKDFKYDWESLRGSTQRRSLRKQEIMLRRLIHSQSITPEQAKKMKKYLPKPQEVPLDILDYRKKDDPVKESVRYTEVNVPEGILTKLAAIRLHMHYGDYIPGPDSPYLDFHTKHKKLL